MERRIDLSNLDLDLVEDVITSRLAAWTSAGLSTGNFTWTDNDADWPAPLHTDRSQIKRPRSLGISVQRTDVAEAQFVIYAGGWADAEWFAPDAEQVDAEYVELDTSEEVGPLVDRIVARISTI